jgi:hypothetical protein
MTYVNSVLIIGIIIFLIPCNKLPTVATTSATAAMLPMPTRAFSIAQQDTITTINLILEFALTACIIVGVIILFWKFCYQERKNKLSKTLFYCKTKTLAITITTEWFPTLKLSN